MERLGDARGLIEYLNVAGKISVAFENDWVGSSVHPHVPVSVKDTGLCVDLQIGEVRKIDVLCRTDPLSRLRAYDLSVLPVEGISDCPLTDQIWCLVND
jgi:hypothetical protein